MERDVDKRPTAQDLLNLPVVTKNAALYRIRVNGLVPALLPLKPLKLQIDDQPFDISRISTQISNKNKAVYNNTIDSFEKMRLYDQSKDSGRSGDQQTIRNMMTGHHERLRNDTIVASMLDSRNNIPFNQILSPTHQSKRVNLRSGLYTKLNPLPQIPVDINMTKDSFETMQPSSMKQQNVKASQNMYIQKIMLANQ